MLYLGFFKRSFSKTHLFIYLCILEILPLVVIVKYFFVVAAIGIFFKNNDLKKDDK